MVKKLAGAIFAVVLTALTGALVKQWFEKPTVTDAARSSWTNQTTNVFNGPVNTVQQVTGSSSGSSAANAPVSPAAEVTVPEKPPSVSASTVDKKRALTSGDSGESKLISSVEPSQRMIKPAKPAVVAADRVAEPAGNIGRAEAPPQNYAAERNVSSNDASREKRAPVVILDTKAPSIPIARPERSAAQKNTLCPTGQVLVATTQGGLSRGEGKCELSNCIDGIDVQATERAVARGVRNPDGSPIRIACL